MEEKILIKSTKSSFRTALVIWLVITAIIVFILHMSIYKSAYDREYEWLYNWHYWGNAEDAAKEARESCGYILWFTDVIPIATSLLCYGIFFLVNFFMEMVVTDKRVYGKTYFGRRVDLPVDSISSVGSAWFKGISVATSSGRLTLTFIKNAREIHETIRELLIIRQEEKKQKDSMLETTPQSSADAIKEYKALFDEGIITQEEFEAKKKQILGM